VDFTFSGTTKQEFTDGSSGAWPPVGQWNYSLRGNVLDLIYGGSTMVFTKN